LPALILMDTGLAVNNTVAVVEGFQRDPGEFVRTPKFSVVGVGESCAGKLYQGRDSWLCWVELAIGLYFSATVAVAIQMQMWPALPFLLLYQMGYLYIGGLSLAQWRRDRDVAVAAT